MIRFCILMIALLLNPYGLVLPHIFYQNGYKKAIIKLRTYNNNNDLKIVWVSLFCENRRKTAEGVIYQNYIFMTKGTDSTAIRSIADTLFQQLKVNDAFKRVMRDSLVNGEVVGTDRNREINLTLY